MTISIVPYTTQHQANVRDLITQDVRIHYHLDWHSLDTWLQIAREPSILAYDAQQRLAGVILFTPPTQGYVWVRLVALHKDGTIGTFATMLLQQAVSQAQRWGIRRMMMLETVPWLKGAMQAVGFQLTDQIVHYWRRARPVPHFPERSIQLRQADLQDADTVLRVDHAAFAAPWRLQSFDMQAIFPKILLLTVAHKDAEVVGYQLSTQHHNKVHLTRLAVVPASQRLGVASALVEDLLRRFPERDITVNTQQSNSGSRRFYESFGFRRLSFRTPVWQRKIDPQ